jgi:hypothetical protein
VCNFDEQGRPRAMLLSSIAPAPLDGNRRRGSSNFL